MNLEINIANHSAEINTIFGNLRFYHDLETKKGLEAQIIWYKIQERQTNYMKTDHYNHKTKLKNIKCSRLHPWHSI